MKKNLNIAYLNGAEGMIRRGGASSGGNGDISSKPIINYEFVDLGLSVNWATCNVGATKPEGSGLFFQWGDTQGYKITELGDCVNEEENTYLIKSMTPHFKLFSQNFYDYKWYDNKTKTLIKYTEKDNLTKLKIEDDAAYSEYSKMRIPTKDEYEELLNSENIKFDNCEINGVNGVKATSLINGNSVFFPFSGTIFDGMLYYKNTSASFISSTLHEEFYDSSYYSYFYVDSQIIEYDYRIFGCSIRPVKDK